MMMLPRHHFPPHSPNHAYMHESVHIEPPATWKKQPAKNKESTKSYKNVLNPCSFRRNLVIWKRKSNQQKQSFTKATKMLQINTLKRNLERKKQLQYNIQLQKCKNMMMLPRHHFPSHSPNHAYMHETVHLELPPQLGKATSKKQRVY